MNNLKNKGEENYVVLYENDNKPWVTYVYDFDLKKYVISFNENKIKNNRLDKNAEYMVVALCIMICDETKSTSLGRKLLKLLFNYEKKLSVEF